MKYHPENHHRRSIRLKGYDYTATGAYFITICTHQRQCLFGAIGDGEMQLNELGELVHACWQRLPFHFPTLTLDAAVVMPNHIHGILILDNPLCRGAALDQNSEILPNHSCPNATPNPDHGSHPNSRNNPQTGVAFGQGIVNSHPDHLPNAAPLRLRLVAGSVGAMVLNFKSVTLRSRWVNSFA